MSEPKKYSREWWLSDEAVPHRCAEYLRLYLMSSGSRQEAVLPEKAAPEWPAIKAYVVSHDEERWIECQIPTYIRDWLRAHPQQTNLAAIELIA